ncbi:hypothetical protein [Cylindrospermopsis raciborskii]|uniref:hypothetical protein n=1 Tax=Cylindrospermopsis raciborskii TaxID=77022 RepID=UPI0008DE1C47|nr:hypothetical protein [Cylindrospermopsis raciborskii]NLQ06212.1 hypothetical protein [Cylindrospermopsis raciborskii MVCC19]OHY34152.1 hypothetical protein BCV64_06910 [Cylindrospermopsis raciborskii MVCC14]
MIKDAESLRKIGNYETYSQAHQDLFVRIMLGFKQNGIYVEIGAAEPKQSNNTYILERDLQWIGLSLEIDAALVGEYNSIRNNKCLLADATKFDFDGYFRENRFPTVIDYLSLDIDPAHITYQALENLPLSDYRFSVITYEHDRYASGPEMMVKSRQLLENLGYIRVVSNVRCCGRDFEDWWVDPLIVSPQIYEPFISENIECRDIFKSV